MALPRIGRTKSRDLGSPWKLGHLLNDLRLLIMDVVAISEIRLPSQQDVMPIFGGRKFTYHFSKQVGWNFNVAPERSRPQDEGHLTEPRMQVPNVNHSNGNDFTPVAVVLQRGLGDRNSPDI